MSNSGWVKAGLLATAVSIILNIIGMIPCISCLFLPITCIAWFAIPMGAGYLAAEWSGLKRDEFSEGAKNGALAGVVLGILSGGVNFFLNIIKSLLNLSSQTALTFLEENSEISNLLPSTLGIGGTIISGCICFFTGIVLNVLFSTLGGIIKIALSKK